MPLSRVAVSGADLLYWRQFTIAVAALTGELFIHDEVDSAADPQRAWLQRLSQMLPPAEAVTITPASTFDHEAGRVFGFRVACACDLALAAGSLVLSRLLAPRGVRGG